MGVTPPAYAPAFHQQGQQLQQQQQQQPALPNGRQQEDRLQQATPTTTTTSSSSEHQQALQETTSGLQQAVAVPQQQEAPMQRGGDLDLQSCWEKQGPPLNWTKGKLIGAGAFGRVFQGLDNETGHILAVKQVGRGRVLCSLCSHACVQLVCRAWYQAKWQDNRRQAAPPWTWCWRRHDLPTFLPSHTVHAWLQVALTKDEALKGRVAEHIKALEAEVAVLQQLNHRNIVRYLGTERSDDTLNIFLEYVPGGSIASLIEVSSCSCTHCTHRKGTYNQNALQGSCVPVPAWLMQLHALPAAVLPLSTVPLAPAQVHLMPMPSSFRNLAP